MHRLIPLLPLILASCGVERGPPGPPHFDVAQCLATLDRLGVKYRRLPDKDAGNGCVIRGAVQLLDIGVPVTNLGALACPAARQLTLWVREDVQGRALAHFGSPVTKIESFGTYNCRPVNGVAGARISEHGYANAVDIAGFQFKNGRRLSVVRDWTGPDPDAQFFLRETHDAGCRRFSIVLGPDANSNHSNHFHFDMGRGRYCR